jgi:hypothetical protein
MNRKGTDRGRRRRDAHSRGERPTKKAPWRPQLFDHPEAGTALRGIVESCPGVELPARLLAKIGALDETGDSPNVARIIDEMMAFGLHSRSAEVSRDEILFGTLARIGAFDESGSRPAWLDVVKRDHPDLAQSWSDAELIALHAEQVSKLVSEVMEIGGNLRIEAFSREQVLFGLNLINCFFLAPHSPIQTLIGKLIEDLIALDSGSVEPALQRVAVNSRHKDTRFLRIAKSAAGGACDKLIRGGMLRDRAATKVAQILNRHKMPLGKRVVEAKTVLQWRRSFMGTNEFRSWALALPFEDALRDFEETVKCWSTEREKLLGPCD